jgi:osmotically-inducible protein OsmY
MTDAACFNSFRRTSPVHQALAVALLISMGALGGCAGTAAYQERGIQGVARDMATATRMRTKLLDAGEGYVTGIGVEVFEGRILLTGALLSEDMRAQAVSMAWKTDGVKDVLNEIQIGNSSLRDLATDSWITTQLQSKITLDKNILAINYFIETVNATIYLIGVAQHQQELKRVIAHAKNINYVKQIINHVRIKKGAS